MPPGASMKNDLSSVPLWPLLAGMTAGITIGLATDISLWWVLPVVAVALIFMILRHAVVSVILLAVSIGWIDMSLNRAAAFPDVMDGTVAWYKGTVYEVREGESSRSIGVSVEACGSDSCAMEDCRHFDAIVYVGSMLPVIETGDKVMINMSLTRPEFDPDLPYEADYTQSFIRQRVEATAFVSSADITVSDHGNGLFYWFRKLRASLSALILRSSLDEDTGVFVNAILLGDTSLLPDGIRNDFSSAGMAHLLALSGMHVAIIAMLISIALFPLTLLRYNSVRYMIVIALLWLYAVMTGMAPSVVRAVVMATLLLAGHILRRDTNPLNNLCVAAIVILLFDPMALVAPGFQLSFVAVLAILTIAPAVNRVNRRTHPWLFRIVSWVTVCVAAVLGTGMLAAYYFHIYPLYFLFGNLIAVLVMPLLMGASAILVLLEACGLDPLWLCGIIDAMYGLIAWSAGAVSSLYGAVIDQLYFPAWVLVPYYLAVVALLLWLVKGRAVYGYGMLTMAAVTLASVYFTAPSLPQAEYFITRNAYRTDMIIRHGSDAYLLTTAPVPDTGSAVEECKRKYRDYFGRAGVRDLRLLPDTCIMDGLSRRGLMLAVGADTYMILNRCMDITPVSGRVRYALVCRGYSGTIGDLGQVADTVLLSRDIDIRRHDRYIRQLQRDSVPYRSLRGSSYHRILY